MQIRRLVCDFLARIDINKCFPCHDTFSPEISPFIVSKSNVFLCIPQPNYNLYGQHPFFLNVEPNQDVHGVFLLNSNAMGKLFLQSPQCSHNLFLVAFITGLICMEAPENATIKWHSPFLVQNRGSGITK